MLRVAYLECTGDLWAEAAARLAHEERWAPVYWSGAASFETAVLGRFPDVAFHENTSAVKGQLPAWLDDAGLPAVGQDLLDELAGSEPHAVRMMDRMDPDGGYDYVARTRLFRRHVAIGLAILDKLRPELAVFSAAPHLVYDYTFYNLCRLRGVDTVVFVETAIDGLVFATPTYEGASEEIGRTYRTLVEQGSPPRLSPAAAACAEKLKAEYDKAVPNYIVELYQYQPVGPAFGRSREKVDQSMRKLAERIMASRQPDAQSELRRLVAKSWRSINRVLLDAAKRLPMLHMAGPAAIQSLADVLAVSGRGNVEALADALDCTHHLYLAVESEYPLLFRSTDTPPVTYFRSHDNDPWEVDVGYVEYWLYRLLALRKRQALAESYRKVACAIDLAKPFIYVPLQYQPEVSTQPLAGYYADQELTIEQLSRTAPEGWFVYVKEHPFQFDKKGSGEQCRSIDFYQRLIRFPNVRVVPLDTPPFALIDHAKAVATATGTSGWEAIARGTPVLLFGHCWYLACEGAFDARTVAGCRRAIDAIDGGYSIDQTKVHLFMQALESVGFRGYTIPDLAADSGVQATQNAAGFVEALRRRVRGGSARSTDVHPALQHMVS